MSQGWPARTDRDERRWAFFEALAAAAVVTAAVKVVSLFVPQAHVATAVGFAFLAATWWLVWRRDDARVRRFGLALGGLVMPGKLSVAEVASSFARAMLWALAFAAVCFVPFYFGWTRFWAPTLHFSLSVRPQEAASEIFGQVVVIALPEEAFYRGYLQTRLDDAFPWRVSVFGASIGAGLPAASAIFALGHLATVPHPARLAVFFPALLFGWLRARTGGVGASVAFHAMCNVFSEALGRGYGVY
jgi:membrane protease YdiL (CAAX protease family)